MVPPPRVTTTARAGQLTVAELALGFTS